MFEQPSHSFLWVAKSNLTFAGWKTASLKIDRAISLMDSAKYFAAGFQYLQEEGKET